MGAPPSADDSGGRHQAGLFTQCPPGIGRLQPSQCCRFQVNGPRGRSTHCWPYSSTEHPCFGQYRDPEVRAVRQGSLPWTEATRAAKGHVYGTVLVDIETLWVQLLRRRAELGRGGSLISTA
jgi:hypothetical protein